MFERKIFFLLSLSLSTHTHTHFHRDAGRDRYLFETLNVQTGLSRRGQDVTWFNRRDEVIVSDTRPESFRRKIGATTQFTKTPEHLLRSERFNLGR
jgi:hypothetical protein